MSPMRVLKVRGVLGLDHQVASLGSHVRRSNNAVEADTKVGEVNAECALYYSRKLLQQ